MCGNFCRYHNKNQLSHLSKVDQNPALTQVEIEMVVDGVEKVPVKVKVPLF